MAVLDPSDVNDAYRGRPALKALAAELAIARSRDADLAPTFHDYYTQSPWLHESAAEWVG